VRDILVKDKNLNDLIFDTTGVGYFKGGKKIPELADLNAQLAKEKALKVKVTRIAEVQLPKTEAIYEVAVSGLN
jgi:hypothetical protein